MATADWPYPRRVLLAVAVVLVALLLWRASHVVILLFGGVVLAAALRALARVFERRLGLGARAAVVSSVLIVAGTIGAFGWWVGDALADQLAGVSERLPKAGEAVAEWLRRTAIGRELLVMLQGLWDGGLDARQLARFTGLTLGVMGSALLVVFVGVYLAADPALYRRGLLRLVPTAQRATVAAAMDAAGQALSRWLLGQAISMLFLGTTTAIGLALLNTPLALALGLITGALAFVPFFGAITAGVLATLLAFVEGPQAALYVALMFIAIQQVEENVVLPLVHRWSVQLPPVLSLIAALVFGSLFGLLGVMFATPLMVVTIELVRKLYVEGVLEAQ